MIQTLTIGLSAFLLFLIQPMMAKTILPLFGGGSSIWLISLIFYQSLLLAGYAFCHWMTRRLAPMPLAVGYGLILISTLFFIPLRYHFDPSLYAPALGIFVLLLSTIGMPYFILSTTGPMVQWWIADRDHRFGQNPYVLFAVSNAGSLLGLLSYPFLFEAFLSRSRQLAVWSYGYYAYAGLLVASLLLFFKGRHGQSRLLDGDESKQDLTTVDPISKIRKAGWLINSMIPTAALLAFTHHLTVDIVNFPLLWILPLCLYLISFVVCFTSSSVSEPGPVRTLSVLLPVALMCGVMRGEFDVPFLFRMAVTCVCLFSLCMFFHGNLERLKPATSRLTTFYLYVSMGGCLGSIATGILAPLLFRSNFELPAVLIFSLYFILSPASPSAKKKPHSFLRPLFLLILLGLVYFTEEIARHSDITFRGRSFYGTYTIRDLPHVPGRQFAARILKQGTTTHGGEAWDPKGRPLPIAYYHPDSGVGLVLTLMPRIKTIGVVGLGTGIVSYYGRQGQRFDFFEIDPLVIQLAQSRFSVMKDSPAGIRHIVGDARVNLRKMPDKAYDLLIMDAFTSGSIPTHMITVEAVEEVLAKTAPDGLILYHISNRFLKLLPVLACAAERYGLSIRHHLSGENETRHQFSAHWVLLTRTEAMIDRVMQLTPGWRQPEPEKICWTDEYTHLWPVVSFR